MDCSSIISEYQAELADWDMALRQLQEENIQMRRHLTKATESELNRNQLDAVEEFHQYLINTDELINLLKLDLTNLHNVISPKKVDQLQLHKIKLMRGKIENAFQRLHGNNARKILEFETRIGVPK